MNDTYNNHFRVLRMNRSSGEVLHMYYLTPKSSYAHNYPRWSICLRLHTRNIRIHMYVYQVSSFTQAVALLDPLVFPRVPPCPPDYNHS